MAKREPLKDGHTLRENRHTQALVRHRVFNNPDVVAEGWYPVCPSKKIRRGKAHSFVISYQRIAVYRGMDDKVRALDAFCPHMGADLANGRVVGDELECYFHQWRFSGQGKLTNIRCRNHLPRDVSTKAYPIEEKYGHIWVYSGSVAPYPVPTCPGLEGHEVASLRVGTVTLYAHHHVMMAGGIDLQHFASVHNLDIDFDLEVEHREAGVADWKLAGTLPKGAGWRTSLGRWLLGGKVGYSVRFGGGTVAGITYGPKQRWFDKAESKRTPPLHILWGCVPQQNGVSQVTIFILTRKRKGFFGRLKSAALIASTAVLLRILKDDDVKAFPHMRFNTGRLIVEDKSLGRFVQFINRLPISIWSKEAPLTQLVSRGKESGDTDSTEGTEVAPKRLETARK